MENNTLENTYESPNLITRNYFRAKVWCAIKIAKLKREEIILDFGCFPEGTLVYNNNLEEIPIEKIKVDDSILTAEGNFKKVKKIFKRDYEGDLYEIKTPYSYSLTATKEHPILCIKRAEVGCISHGNKSQRTCNTNYKDGGCSMCRKENKYLKPEYKPISILDKGDYIAIPRSIKTEINGSDENIKLARLLGWYLAEGNQIYSHKPKICGISFNLSINEEEYAEEIKRLAIDLGATSVTVFKREKKNTITINCFGKKIAELIIKLGGRYSDKKCLDASVFNWDRDEHINLLQSYFLGDGHYKKGAYTVKSISKRLIQQIRLIFNKYGICPGIGSYKSPLKKRDYSLVLSGEDISFLKESKKYPSKKRYRINDRYIFIPIIKISKKNIKTRVYNLEVEDEPTYIASGICVHNCGGGWLERKLRGYKIYGYDINPEKTFISDYRKIVPDKIFCLDVFEHIPIEEIGNIIDNFKEMNKNKNFELIVSIPTENKLSRIMRKFVGKPEVPKEHITKYKDIIKLLNSKLKLIKKFNFLTVTYILKFRNQPSA